MAKPMWYEEEISKNKEWEQLAPGGHRLKIRKIEVTKSKRDQDMWIVHFDTTDDDKQPNYYLNAYVNDSRADKVWQGRSWLVIDENACSKDKNGNDYFYGRANLSSFTEAIEKSNAYEVDWSEEYTSEAFAEQFTDKLIGGVFFKEYYSNASGEARSTVKLKYFRGIKNVENAKIPAEVDRDPSPVPATGQSGAEGFMQLADDIEEGIPFNA